MTYLATTNRLGRIIKAVPKSSQRQCLVASHSSRWLTTSSDENISDAEKHLSNGRDAFYDVLICGGGVVGCSLARSLNASMPSLRVGLLEARDFNPPPPSSSAVDSNTDNTPPVPHPRSYALSPSSLNLFGEKTIQDLKDRLGYYESMQVWQANSPASLTFTTRDLHIDPSKATPYLGACVEDIPLVASLWYQIQQDSKTTCYTSTTLSTIDNPASPSIQATEDNEQPYYDDGLITVTTNDGQTIQTALLVGADGGNSYVRKTSDISRIGTEYNQHALTFTVELESSMYQRAFQRFLPDGSILALLPTYSSKHAVIVWSTYPSIVKQWKKDGNDVESNLVDVLNGYLMEGPQRIPPLLERQQQQQSSTVETIGTNLLYGAEKVLDTIHYGLAMASHHPNPKFAAPPKITKVVSPKFSFPLSCYQAKNYMSGKRVVLIGDAAHTVHPMAGQGLNIGLGDVTSLLECIQKSYKAGMDVSTFLQLEYNKERHLEVSTSLLGIHTLQKLFSNQQDTLLQHGKTFGMNIIQNVSPLRRQIVQTAAYGI